MPKNRRASKYRHIIASLEDDTLYSAAMIARHAQEKGFLKGEDIRLERNRIRIALNRHSTLHEFPDEGDGLVTLPGCAPAPGWYGWRWKEDIKPK